MYRKLLTSIVFQDEGVLKVWLWCLLRATYQPRPIEFMGEEIELKAGDFITGTFSAADELKMSKSRVWRILEKLIRWKNISVKSGNRFTIISVNKFEEYQNDALFGRETIENQSGNHRETVGKPSGTNKKDKKEEEGKKERTPASIESVNALFLERSYPPEEAEKFFAYYSANGWRVGKNPMQDWKAAAAGWVMRSKEYSNGKSGNGSRGGREVFTNETIERLVKRTSPTPGS